MVKQKPDCCESVSCKVQILTSYHTLTKVKEIKGYEQAKKYSDCDAMVDEYIRVMEEAMEKNDRKKEK